MFRVKILIRLAVSRQRIFARDVETHIDRNII